MRISAAVLSLVLAVAAILAPPVYGWSDSSAESEGDGTAGAAPGIAGVMDEATVRTAVRPRLDETQAAPKSPHMKMVRGLWTFGPHPETAGPDTALTAAYDPWTGFDKVQHMTFSFLWVLGSQYVLVNKAGWVEQHALPYSVGLTATLGLAKELYDWRISPSRYFSPRDVVADVVGIVAGIVIIIL